MVFGFLKYNMSLIWYVKSIVRNSFPTDYSFVALVSTVRGHVGLNIGVGSEVINHIYPYLVQCDRVGCYVNMSRLQNLG